MIKKNESAPNVRNGGDIHVRKVVVLGGGSAGFLVALALARRLPHLETVVVRSTKMGVIGVGEGTIASVVRYLHSFLDIEPQKFHQAVLPSIKLGIQFQWGAESPFHYSFAPQFTAPTPRDPQLSLARGYYCREDATYADVISALMYRGKVAVKDQWGDPKLTTAFAYHLENKRFVEFLEDYGTECGIEKIDAIVGHVERGPAGVTALNLDNGQRLEADLFVDCSGFGSELLGRALEEPFVSYSDALLCDRALVGGWPRTGDTYHAFTTAEAMDAGWSWRIEHDDIINRGYVYSSSFISDETAEQEFRRKNPKIMSTRMLKFRSGVYRRAWVGNVVAIGNAYGFVEPLEATAIGMICAAGGLLVKLLESGGECLTDVQRNLFNGVQDSNWQQIRDFLAMHYKPNTSIHTPFWKACQNDIPVGDAQDILDYFQAVGPDFGALEVRMRKDIFGSEGYLSMLVGQGVPYRRSVRLPETELAAWRQFKQRMGENADRGMGMKKYLSLIRSGESALP